MAQTKKVPLTISGIPPEQNGSIDFFSTKPIDEIKETAEGIFSFSYYLKGEKPFDINLIYYQGLYSYIKFIHENPVFAKWYCVIYTNKTTLPVLMEKFTHALYPRLIFAVIDWPYYSLSNGDVESTIHRCVRYHSFEFFTKSYVFIRDADTIFKNELQSIIIEKEESLTKFIKNLGDWEKNFFELLKTGKIAEPIVLGGHERYRWTWHSNFQEPFPLVQEATLFYTEKYNTYEKIRFQSPFGVCACFVSVKPNRPNDLWFLCLDYLFQRYHMVIDKGIKVISNEYSGEVYRYNGPTKGKQVYTVTGDNYGKDERVLIFGILRKYLDIVFFFKFLYSRDITLYNIANDNMIFVGEVDIGEYEQLGRKMQRMSEFLNPDYVLLTYNHKFEHPTSRIKYVFNDFIKRNMKAALERYEAWVKEDKTNLKKNVIAEILKKMPGKEEKNLFLQKAGKSKKRKYKKKSKKTKRRS
jgi:hypothetical protein